MKQLLFLSLLFLSFGSMAQTPPDTVAPSEAEQMVGLNVSLSDAQAYASIMEDPAIIAAISKKFRGITDTTAVRTIRLREQDLINLAVLSNAQPGADWAARTARMRTKVQTLLAGRPWLTSQVVQIQSNTAKENAEVLERGARKMERHRAYEDAQQ